MECAADFWPLSWIIYAIVLMASGMFPVGLMLGSPCSSCCRTSCSLNDSGPHYMPRIPWQYACDNENPSVAQTLGVEGNDLLSSEINAYVDLSRQRIDDKGSTVSLAKSLNCENICDLAALVPTYRFFATPPTITLTLSFTGNEVEYRPYYSQFRTTGSVIENHCYRHTTICKASGSYVLSHTNSGVFSYATNFGADLFSATASLHRCNDTPMWLVIVVYVSRTIGTRCNVSNTWPNPDPNACNEAVLAQQSKQLRCCVGYVVHLATACVRTQSTFSERVDCNGVGLVDRGYAGRTIGLDVPDASSLSVSENINVLQYVTTSGNDVAFGNFWRRPGIVLPEVESPALGVVYDGKNAPCRCLDRIHTFKNQMTVNTAYGGPFTLSAT